MATVSSAGNLQPIARRLLLVDAGFEAVAAVLLSGLVGRAHWWLNVEKSVTLSGAIVFAVVAIGLAAASFAKATDERFLRGLAFANIGGGLAIWVAAGLKWSQFEPGGHWLVAFIADGCLLLGVLQVLVLRRVAD
ncbi:MAG: hypothetical protein ABI577_13930 [bacterium]